MSKTWPEEMKSRVISIIVYYVSKVKDFEDDKTGLLSLLDDAKTSFLIKNYYFNLCVHYIFEVRE